MFKFTMVIASNNVIIESPVEITKKQVDVEAIKDHIEEGYDGGTWPINSEQPMVSENYFQWQITYE